MMRMIVLLMLALVSVASCSVKEDRSDCPARLILDFKDVDTAVFKSLNLLVTHEGETVFSDSVGADDFTKDYVRDVPHGSLRVNVWAGDGDRVVHEHGVVIPYGCECPPIYMHSFIADTEGELWRETVCLKKNHCRLTVMMEGVEKIPYSLTFKGNVDGYRLDGQPSSGDFSCVAYPAGTRESQALLPRQTDSSLLMEVDDGTSVIKTFAIGEYIASSGYDWTSGNLEDVTIVLDYYITYVKITIQEWDKEYVYNITL